MSEYGTRHRTRPREPEYIEVEDEYSVRGGHDRDLVLRPRDDYEDDYRAPIEARRRPPREEYPPPSRRARSHDRRDYDDYDYYDYYYDERDYAPKPRRSRYDDDHYSDDKHDDRRKSRGKSKVSEIIDTLGLGGVASAVTNKTRSSSRRRRGGDDYDDYSRQTSRDREREETRQKWQQAAKAAVITGVIEAVRSRNEPGGWQSRGTRVATAALGAAGIDGLLGNNNAQKSKRHIVESVIGGLAVNHVASGPRDKGSDRGRSRSRPGHSRSRSVMDRIRSRSRSVFGRRDRSTSSGSADSRGRSQSRGGIKSAATLGGLAVAGKAIYDRVRSKSRGRLRGRSRSVASEDSYVPSRRPRYTANRGRGRDRPPSDDDNDDDDDDYDDRDDGDYHQVHDRDDQTSRARQTERKTGGGARSDRSRSSSISTTDYESRRKKTRGKEILTAGLATVATIHAAHGIYSSMKASEERHKLITEGEITPEEARKRKSKNMLQDAAAVGIAALGIKSAFGEWKEMNESRKEKHELETNRRRRLKMRQKRAREEANDRRRQIAYGHGASYPPEHTMSPIYSETDAYYAYKNSLPPPPVGPAR